MKNAANRLSAAANYDKINYEEMRFGAAQKNIMEVNDMKKDSSRPAGAGDSIRRSGRRCIFRQQRDSSKRGGLY